jgi:hypothetical protein
MIIMDMVYIMEKDNSLQEQLFMVDELFLFYSKFLDSKFNFKTISHLSH